MKFSLGAGVLAGLFAARSVNYLLFHMLAELFSIIIAGTIFTITWNFRKFYQGSFLVFIGTASLFVGFIDLFHALAFKGMGVFPDQDANLPTQLWIAARYLQSLALLSAPLFLRRKIRIEAVMAVFLGITVVLMFSIFRWKIFPVCYVEGSGLTPFKIASEYVIIAILGLSAAILYAKRALLDRKVLAWMLLSIAITMLGELAFTFYLDVTGLFNLLGHFCKIVAFFLIYKALLETEAGSIYTDMTELRAAQKALREKELQAQTSLAELRSVYANTPVGLCFLDAQLRYQAINAALAGINGLPAQEHIGKKVTEILPTKFGEELSRWAEQVLRSGEPIFNREFTRSAGGDPCRTSYWLLSFHPVFGENQQPMGVSCVVQNITDRKCAEQALLASEKRFRSVVESNMIGVVFADPHTGKVTDANDEFLRISGRSRAELETGQIDWPADLYSEVGSQIGDGSQGALAAPPRTPLEIETTRPDGTRVPLIIGGSYLDEERKHLVAFVLDNTERKLAQEKLAEASLALLEYAEKLTRSNQDLEEFAFVASHDLQEPLRKIKMFGDFLQKKLQNIRPEETRADLLEDAAHMQSAAGRMQKMIEGLLELSRVHRRGGEFGRVSLKTLAAEVVYDLEERIRASGGQVIVEDLPDIQADEVQIRQLLQNLIGNALKFHRAGVPPLIEVSGSTGGGSDTPASVTLVVKDNGIGFDEKYAERIFQPFQRLHGRSEYEGTGLGLSICQKIVERHHGTIEARSQPGQGAQFWIMLPEIQVEA